jgi:hypothetical protein
MKMDAIVRGSHVPLCAPVALCPRNVTVTQPRPECVANLSETNRQPKQMSIKVLNETTIFCKGLRMRGV